jgi:hypothetical protein
MEVNHASILFKDRTGADNEGAGSDFAGNIRPNPLVSSSRDIGYIMQTNEKMENKI